MYRKECQEDIEERQQHRRIRGEYALVDQLQEIRKSKYKAHKTKS